MQPVFERECSTDDDSIVMSMQVGAMQAGIVQIVSTGAGAGTTTIKWGKPTANCQRKGIRDILGDTVSQQNMEHNTGKT